MPYSTLDQVPSWASATISRMVNTGLIQCKEGIFEFPLSDELLYIIIILSRRGII